ncbi:MAG: hypothetical protein CMD20_05520 [Flavobacteriales bacterium]|nr:hypothetical protein [Flavobacteriales bacterium]
MKYFLAIPLLALLITSCNKNEEIVQDEIEQNQELLMGVWETGEKFSIKETEASTSTCINDIKEFNFTSTEELTCRYCYGSYDYNWSCTADKIILPGLSDEIEEYEIIILDSEELIFEGSRTYIDENSITVTHKIRIELKRFE